LSPHFNHKVCWKHFKPCDFVKEISQDDINNCHFGELKKNIVPSQNLPEKTDLITETQNISNTEMNLEDESFDGVFELKNEPIEHDYEEFETKVNPEDDNFFGVFEVKNEPIDNNGYEDFYDTEIPLNDSDKFEIKTELEEHVEAVVEVELLSQFNKPHQCALCEARFARKAHLNHHTAAVHEGKKPFKCDICNHDFTTFGSMKRHKSAVHEGLKDMQCGFCEANFTRKDHLNQHIASVHEGKKPFKFRPHQCNLCTANFARKAHLKHHITAVHEGKKPFKCDICSHLFTTFGSMKRHKTAVHERIKGPNSSGENCFPNNELKKEMVTIGYEENSIKEDPF